MKKRYCGGNCQGTQNTASEHATGWHPTFGRPYDRNRVQTLRPNIDNGMKPCFGPRQSMACSAYGSFRFATCPGTSGSVCCDEELRSQSPQGKDFGLFDAAPTSHSQRVNPPSLIWSRMR